MRIVPKAIIVIFLAASVEAMPSLWNKLPRETFVAGDVMNNVLGKLDRSPAPTPMPRAQRHPIEYRDERDDRLLGTCGYISGIETASLFCDPQSICVLDQLVSAVGCCPETNTNCNIWTTCLNSENSDQFTVTDGYTLWCGFNAFPKCVTHVYASEEELVAGYTVFGCGKSNAKDTDVINLSPSGKTERSVRTSRSFPHVYHTTTVSAMPTSGSTSENADEEGSNGGSNTAAIAGGAVGGAVGLSLVVAALVVMRKHKAKNSKLPASSGFAFSTSKYENGGIISPPEYSTSVPPDNSERVVPGTKFPHQAPIMYLVDLSASAGSTGCHLGGNGVYSGEDWGQWQQGYIPCLPLSQEQQQNEQVFLVELSNERQGVCEMSG